MAGLRGSLGKNQVSMFPPLLYLNDRLTKIGVNHETISQ